MQGDNLITIGIRKDNLITIGTKKDVYDMQEILFHCQ